MVIDEVELKTAAVCVHINFCIFHSIVWLKDQQLFMNQFKREMLKKKTICNNYGQKFKSIRLIEVIQYTTLDNSYANDMTCCNMEFC